MIENLIFTHTLEKDDLFTMWLKKLSSYLSLKAGVNKQESKNTRTWNAWVEERRTKER